MVHSLIPLESTYWMPGNMLSWLLSILTLCSEASGPKREKVSPAGSSLDIGMGLHFSFICPCGVPQELTKDLDLPVPRGSPQLPAPAGPGMAQLGGDPGEETWQPCHLARFYSLGVKMDSGRVPWERQLSLEWMSRLSPGITDLGKGFCCKKGLAPRYIKIPLQHSVKFGASES